MPVVWRSKYFVCESLMVLLLSVESSRRSTSPRAGRLPGGVSENVEDGSTALEPLRLFPIRRRYRAQASACKGVTLPK